MSGFGRYDPTNVEHGSSLFTYGEVPLESAKLNRWNGNIRATVDFTTRELARLLGAGSADFVLSLGTGTELVVQAQAPPDLTVSVGAGAAIVSGFLAGIDTAATVPATGTLSPPAALPRIDAVYLTATGALGLAQGAEAESPAPPATLSESLCLAHVHWRPGAACIKDSDDGANAWLDDRRPVRVTAAAHRHAADRSPLQAPDGARTSFATANPFVAGTLDVYLNGLLQKLDLDYGENADRQGYTFAAPPLVVDVIQHRYVQAAP